MTTAEDVANKAKTVDYVVRSVVTAALAVGLVGAVIAAALLKIPLSPDVFALLSGFAGAAIGYYFGNHAAVNGSIMQSTAARRDGDTLRADIRDEVKALTAVQLASTAATTPSESPPANPTVNP